MGADFTEGETYGNAILAIIACFCVIANFIVILTFAVPRNKYLRTPTNLVIMNLSFSDFLFGICALPILSTNWRTNSFSINGHACSFMGVATVGLAAVSVLLITLIAFERYHAIVRENPIPLSTLGIMIALSWVVAIFLGLLGIIQGVGPIQTPCGYFCAANWDKALIQTIICTVVLLSTVVVTGVLYYLIYRKVKDVSSSLQKVIPRSRVSMSSMPPAEIEIGKRMAIIVLVFAANWGCYVTLMVYELVTQTNASPLFDGIAATLGSLNSAINPILYVVLDRRFRTAVRNILSPSMDSHSRSRTPSASKSSNEPKRTQPLRLMTQTESNPSHRLSEPPSLVEAAPV